MNYTVLALTAVLGGIVVDLGLLRTALVGRKAFWTAYAIVLGFQLLVNGVLTGVGIVRYDPDRIIGWRIAYAPVEDLLFGFAMVLVTLSTWVWLGRRARATAPTRRPRPGAATRPGPGR
jgi:lycopene cyclase domain-containing protein